MQLHHEAPHANQRPLTAPRPTGRVIANIARNSDRLSSLTYPRTPDNDDPYPPRGVLPRGATASLSQGAKAAIGASGEFGRSITPRAQIELG